MSGRWEITETAGHVHVIPKADVVLHEMHENCVCVPQVEPVPRSDGSMGWLLTHHSLDGRESAE